MVDPIRILCVFSTLDRGGAETMCMNLYRKIDRSKVQFDFVKHTHSKCAFDDEILSLGGRIFEAPRYKMYNGFLYKKWWENFFAKHSEYRIIHGHFFTISSVYFKVARKFGVKTIGHIHASAVGKSLKSRIINWNLKKFEKYSDYCLACSEMAGKWIYKSKPFTVLKNAVDTELFAYDEKRREIMRAKLGLSESDLMLCVVANIHSVKNPLGTIDIFKAIKTKKPNARLFWVGDGSMRTELENKINAEGLAESVTLLGVRSDVPEILQAADVFMLCSFSEGLGLVAIEAQASGLPCLLSEGVPQEAKVIEKCVFLPLDNTALWADEFECLQKCERTDTRKSIIDSGYDINETSKWLENFYLKISED